MAAIPKTIAEYPACTAPSSNDLVLAWGNSAANTLSITVSNLLGNSNASVVVSAAADLTIANNDTPVSSTAGGKTNNSIWFSNDHIYVVLANGFIRRTALSDF